MPGVGFVLGGLIAAVVDPAGDVSVAGLGVLAILAVAVPLLGSKWLEYAPKRLHTKVHSTLTARSDVMVELIPGGTPIQPDSEVQT